MVISETNNTYTYDSDDYAIMKNNGIGSITYEYYE